MNKNNIVLIQRTIRVILVKKNVKKQNVYYSHIFCKHNCPKVITIVNEWQWDYGFSILNVASFYYLIYLQ